MLKGMGYLDMWFMQCQNLNCQLRFPLDLEQYQGRYCPNCGAELARAEKALAPAAPASARRNSPYALEALLDNIRSALNVGAIFRAADGAGLRKLWLGGISPGPGQSPQIAKTALGAEQNLPWESVPNTLNLALELKSRGYRLLALENAPNARPLFSYRLQPENPDPVLLIVGSEQAGVDPGLLALADEILCLPMGGSKGSLNVAVAFGIAVYWLRYAHA